MLTIAEEEKLEEELALDQLTKQVMNLAYDNSLSKRLMDHDIETHTGMVNYWITELSLRDSMSMDLRKNLIYAVSFHDTGRSEDGTDPSHAKRSAEIAKKIIPNYYPDADLKSIIWGIENHSCLKAPNDAVYGSKESFPVIGNFEVPEGINLLIPSYLWDADRLDMLRFPGCDKVDERRLSTKVAKEFANSSVHMRAYR